MNFTNTNTMSFNAYWQMTTNNWTSVNKWQVCWQVETQVTEQVKWQVRGQIDKAQLQIHKEIKK